MDKRVWVLNTHTLLILCGKQLISVIVLNNGPIKPYDDIRRPISDFISQIGKPSYNCSLCDTGVRRLPKAQMVS